MHFSAVLVFLLSLSGVPAMAAEPAAPVSAAGTTAPAAASTEQTDGSIAAADDAGSRIYLVARIKLIGTDLTHAVFFRHQAIDTLAACEAERTAGLTTGWNYYNRYYLQTIKGFSYKVDYRCTQSEQHIAYWRRGVPLHNFYLVTTGDKKLRVQSYDNFFACRNALKLAALDESIDHFCSVSSQAILDKKT